MDKKIIGFEARIDKSSFKKVNPEFAKVKIYIMYHGENRNDTYISRETVESMIPSLYNIPVIGEWKEDKEDFGGHGGKIEISDEGWKIIDTTKPYGVVPSDSEVRWETVREKNGIDEHEYLTCTAYLWIGRYAELERVLEGECNQSMEIVVTEGQYNDEKGLFEITEAYFSALCILGSGVSPCFESAGIGNYAYDVDKFTIEFSKLKSALKKLNNFTQVQNGKEVKKMDELLKVFAEEGIEFNQDTTVGDLKTKISNFKQKLETNFKKEYEPEIKGFEAKIEEFEGTISTLKTENQSLKTENEKLAQFKNDKEIEEKTAQFDKVFAQFEDALKENEDYTELKKSVYANVMEFDIQEVEDKLFAMYGKAKFSFKHIKSNDKTNAKVLDNKDDSHTARYGELG